MARAHSCNKTLRERFEEKYVPCPMSGCWLWTASVIRTGYGRILGSGRQLELAHRLAWMLYRGPIPDDLNVLHKCDVPGCVNPDHLYLGTPKQNAVDRVIRGRQPRGENMPISRLTEKDIVPIRQSTIGTQALAKLYGVGKRTIGQVRARETWRHVA